MSDADIPPGQAEKLADLYQRLMKLVDRTTVPTGILHRSWLSQFDLTQYDGTAAGPVLTQRQWNHFYFRLTQDALPDAQLVAFDEVNRRAEAHRQGGKLPIGLANFRYNTPRRDFIAAVQAHLQHGAPFEFPTPADAPRVLEERRAFLASALVELRFRNFVMQPIRHRGLNPVFVLPADCYLTNTGSTPQNIEADFGDGNGWRPVRFDQDIPVNYAEPGVKTVNLRAEADGTPLTADFAFEIAAVATGANPVFTIQLVSPSNPQTTGTAYVFAPVLPPLPFRAPFIVCQGYEPAKDPSEFYEFFSSIGKPLLATNDYSLVLVSLDRAQVDSIEDNAGVLVDLVGKLAQLTQQPMLMSGVSMGGLIARYALLQLEASPGGSHCNCYFSFDAPHGGAWVPLGAQAALQYFQPENAGSLTSVPAQEMLMTVLLGNREPDFHTPSAYRTAFLDNIAKLCSQNANATGFPKSTANFLVSCGTGDSASNGVPVGAKVLQWQYAAGFLGLKRASAIIYASPGVGSAVALLSACLDNQPFNSQGAGSVDSAPGGTAPHYWQMYEGFADQKGGHVTDWVEAASNNCFVPTVSALALMDPHNATPNDQTLFQPVNSTAPPPGVKAIMASSTNLTHVTISTDIASWVLSQLGI